jgi:hypothetical protein
MALHPPKNSLKWTNLNAKNKVTLLPNWKMYMEKTVMVDKYTGM